MGLRPGRCYSSLSDRPYTRTAVKVHKRNYIGTSPHNKIRQYNMGNPLKAYTHVVDLKSANSLQVRDNAIESTRITAVRGLTTAIGKENFFMKLRIFPHNILRENKQAQGAGADRVSSGMSHAFGRPIGRSARVKKGKTLYSVLVTEEHVKQARKVLLTLAAKLPCEVYATVHNDVKGVGTIPTKVRDKLLDKKKKEEESETEEDGKTKKGEKGKDGDKKDAKSDDKKDAKSDGKKDDKTKNAKKK